VSEYRRRFVAAPASQRTVNLRLVRGPCSAPVRLSHSLHPRPEAINIAASKAPSRQRSRSGKSPSFGGNFVPPDRTSSAGSGTFLIQTPCHLRTFYDPKRPLLRTGSPVHQGAGTVRPVGRWQRNFGVAHALDAGHRHGFGGRLLSFSGTPQTASGRCQWNNVLGEPSTLFNSAVGRSRVGSEPV
jgi:hypothetical protein